MNTNTANNGRRRFQPGDVVVGDWVWGVDAWLVHPVIRVNRHSVTVGIHRVPGGWLTTERLRWEDIRGVIPAESDMPADLAQVADGQVRVFTRDDIAPGDWVYSDWPGGPHRVARVNPTTASIETQYIPGTDTWWTNKVPYYEITDVRRADTQQPTPQQLDDATGTGT